MAESKSLEEEIKELRELVKQLVKEKAREKEEQPQISADAEARKKEDLAKELKKYHIGEVIRYAIKKDLIKRKTIED